MTWTTGRTFYREHELFTVRFHESRPGEGALPPWINVSQDSVERYLLARARTEPLIDLRFGHRVTAITDASSGTCSDDGVEVTTATRRGPQIYAGSAPDRRGRLAQHGSRAAGHRLWRHFL